jgi:ribonuclease P protein component
LPIETLKRRSQFLHVRGGLRYSTPGFILEAREQRDGTTTSGPRFGFTVSRRIGNAVARNRARRRLRAAVTELAPEHAERGFDYVLIARSQALDRPFDLLKGELGTAFSRIRAQARRKRAVEPAPRA